MEIAVAKGDGRDSDLTGGKSLPLAIREMFET